MVERYPEMQMRSGDTPGCADLADDLSGMHNLAGVNADRRQMAVQRDQAFAVIDKYRIAAEKIIAGIDDATVRRGVHRHTLRTRDIHA